MPDSKSPPSDSEKTKEELFEDNIGLAYFTLAKTFPDFTANEDARQIALIGLWAACLKYDPERGKFVTFAPWCVRSELLKCRDQFMPDYSLGLCGDMADDDNRDISYTGADRDTDMEDKEFTTDFNEFFNGLSPKLSRTVQQRISGATYEQIGKTEGISTEGARLRLKTIEKKFKNFMKEKPNHDKT